MSLAQLDQLGHIDTLTEASGLLGFIFGASADLRFNRNAYMVSGSRLSLADIPGVSVSRASSGTAIVDGVITEFGNDTARIGDDGLLVESAATNYARGISPGASSLSTSGLQCNGAGMSYTFIGTGTDAETGLDYVDVRVQGTATSTFANISFVWANDGPAATVGSAWTPSVWLQLVAGSLTGTTQKLNTYERTSGGSYVGVAGTPPDIASEIPSDRLVRFDAPTVSDGATTAKVDFALAQVHANGAVVDFTLRIAGPQFETGSTATSYIPTEGSPVTRDADSVTLTDLAALGLTAEVLDDDFTSYADQAAAEAAGWTQEGTDWTFDAANDKWTFGGSGARETIYRNFTTVIGDSYVVEFTIAGSGNTEVFLDLTGGLGTKDVNSGFIEAGTHTLQFTATSTTTGFNVRPNSSSTTELISVTIRSAELLGPYTVVVEADYLGGSNAFPWLFAVNDGTGDNEAGAYQNGGNIRPKVQAGNASQADFIAGVDPGGVFKTAISFEANNISASIGGAAAVKDTSASLPSGLTQLVLANSANNQRDNWAIRRLTIIPRAVSDAELQQLSALS